MFCFARITDVYRIIKVSMLLGVVASWVGVEMHRFSL